MKPPTCSLPRGLWTPLGELRLTESGGPPLQATRVALHDDGVRLTVRFDCDDASPWATLRTHDDDLWTEEVVELFLAPGSRTPTRYVEIEVNPLGTRFDASISSPHGDRRDLEVDRGWGPPGLTTRSGATSSGWGAEISLPWGKVPGGDAATLDWRLNLCRIDRPLGEAAEHSAWSPTLVEPADFHRPGRFGYLRRVG